MCRLHGHCDFAKYAATCSALPACVASLMPAPHRAVNNLKEPIGVFPTLGLMPDFSMADFIGGFFNQENQSQPFVQKNMSVCNSCRKETTLCFSASFASPRTGTFPVWQLLP